MSFIVYLVRHGIAEESSSTGKDADRRLTEPGLRKMRRAALGLKRLGVAPDTILSSPLRRAQETAAALSSVLLPETAIEILPPLAPGHTPAEVVRALGARHGLRRLMLVGHQPDLGELASHLLTGSSSLVPLPFKKGAVAAIGIASLPPQSAGTLEWFATPRQLRWMGRPRR
jgi:phosphohistidine phosphatase